MSWLWAPGRYWPAWLASTAALLVLRETWALASGRPQDTLSTWVWDALGVTGHQPVTQWSAQHFLIAAAWLVLVVWLTFHFFLRWWA